MKSNTVDAAEVGKFSRQAGEWWDPHGNFKPLHRINPLRIGWIRDQAASHFGSLAGRALLDIGCGGGLACEPMARLGAVVTGLDASEENIKAAKAHAKQSELTIDYQCTTAEAMASAGLQYDIVLALEIVEHVADVEAFVRATSALVKPGGLIIYSTLNRTFKSFALGVVAAEYVLRIVPRGTHAWEKFLRPSEIARELRHNNIEVREMTGMVMNPLTWKWELTSKDLGVNYLLAGVKS